MGDKGVVGDPGPVGSAKGKESFDDMQEWSVYS